MIVVAGRTFGTAGVVGTTALLRPAPARCRAADFGESTLVGPLLLALVLATDPLSVGLGFFSGEPSCAQAAAPRHILPSAFLLICTFNF